MRQSIRSELESTRSTFHALLDSLADEDLHQHSKNPGWTNGEILFHMALGFFLLLSLVPMVRVFGRLPKGVSKPFAMFLNLSTVPFNWINALGPRVGGRVFTRRSLGNTYDWAIARILHVLDSIKADEWQHGMYYPNRWDSLFSEYMTLENLFYYPTIHFKFHLAQITH